MRVPSLAILDVGHGNAAVLFDSGGVIVIDAGKGGVLLDFLRQLQITTVDILLVSHADEDHIRNAPDLLLDKKIAVRQLYFNSDASKETRIWHQFGAAIKYARRTKGLMADPQLTTSLTGRLDCGAVRVEVLFPPPEMAASAPGGRGKGGVRLTSNCMSAVVRLVHGKIPMVLLAGDVERGCLDFWRDENTSPAAKVLVYPHHGGHPGDMDPVEFAVQLCTAVQPSAVLFSIHRSQHSLPIPDVVSAVKRHNPNIRVACTQLSTHCSRTLPVDGWEHLQDLPSHGRDSGACCAGTILIYLSGSEPEIEPVAGDHLQFIRRSSQSPMCLPMRDN